VQAGGARGSQGAGLPPIGRPGMVHTPHGNYSLTPAAEGFHSASGRLAYGHGGLTQLMQMNRVPGDLGPPLFMPGQIAGLR